MSDRKPFDQVISWSLSKLSAMLRFHPLLCALPKCSEQFKVRWEMSNVFSFFFFFFSSVMRAPGIAVKLWFCFWRDAVTGVSKHVAFTALICEHRNANILVGDLFQLSSVMYWILALDLIWLFFFFSVKHCCIGTLSCIGNFFFFSAFINFKSSLGL